MWPMAIEQMATQTVCIYEQFTQNTGKGCNNLYAYLSNIT